MKYNSIYDLITIQEAAYALPVTVYDGYEWNMKKHIKTSFFYKHGLLLTGNDDNKPVKNITRPILNLAYRAEDIDVKDIHIYVNDSERFHLSFLVKKYHDDVFLRENDLDTFLDEVKEEKIDFGLALARRTSKARPEKIPLQSIAFCNQHDVLSSPFGIKHIFTISDLKAMEFFGWGKRENGANVSIDDLITLTQTEGSAHDTGYSSITANKEYTNESKSYEKIEVYEIHGAMPTSWLEDNTLPDQLNSYTKQLQIVAFYSSKEDKKVGVTLYKKAEPEENIKQVKRDAIFGRACGYGGAEELFEYQVWSNYGMIRMKEMLDSASKTIHLSIGDPAFTKRNKIGNLDNNEVLDVAEGAEIKQLDTYPHNFAIFDKWTEAMNDYAMRMGSASEPMFGDESKAGTPFRSQQLSIQEGKSLHIYRRGKFATFIQEVYQDWIIPHIIKEISKGTKFLSHLSGDEMEYISDCLVTSETNKMIIDKVLNGQTATPEEIDAYKEIVRQEFVKGGSKKFIEIIKGEMKNAELKVKVDIAGKQEDLMAIVDKLSNIFRQIFANPLVLQDPYMRKLFQKILEYSGLGQIDFVSSLSAPKPQQNVLQPSPIQPNQLLNNVKQ